VKGSPENPWPEVFDEFSARVRDYIGPGIDLFLPAFSTTGLVEKAAAQVVLLDAMRLYFQYALKTWCSIPEITLEGTTADWESLARRAEVLPPASKQLMSGSLNCTIYFHVHPADQRDHPERDHPGLSVSRLSRSREGRVLRESMAHGELR
jgi:hypothetical protein